jgi:hypothetical protein
MRELVTGLRIKQFMRRLGEAAPQETKVYLTGGATAVLLGWRASTVDVVLKIVPESDPVFRALPELKEALRLNIELASPDLFIPPLPGWQARSLFIVREGRIDWFHYDPYAQALSKIERGHQRDQVDVDELFRRKLIEPVQLQTLFNQIKPDLIRYPSINPESFELKLKTALAKLPQ